MAARVLSWVGTLARGAPSSEKSSGVRPLSQWPHTRLGPGPASECGKPQEEWGDPVPLANCSVTPGLPLPSLSLSFPSGTVEAWN